MKRILTTLTLLVVVFNLSAKGVLVETENFKNRGGWQSDHQAFEQIGSAYLIAHGLGEPVKDAMTTIQFEKPGEYYVYASTYNWTSPWYDGQGPGAFQIVVNGVTLPNTLGDSGVEWEWQYAGKVTVAGDVEVALRDLSGFDGRCDAIYFSPKKREPSNDLSKLNRFRRKKHGYSTPKDFGEFDLVVAGGGVAGCCTALTAARYGLKVALIDNLPGLGGNHYLSVRLCGVINKNIYPQIGNMLRQLSDLPIPQNEEEYINEPHKTYSTGAGHLLLDKKPWELAVIRKRLLQEAGVVVCQSTHIFDVECRDDKICAVVGKDLITNEEYKFSGKLFADCTGDGVLGYLAGADYRIGRESKDQTGEALAPEVADDKKMGATLWWGSADKGEVSSFPSLEELPWAAQLSDEYHLDTPKGGWFWETGFERNCALEMEWVRDNMLRSIYGNWAYLKNNTNGKYDNYALSHISQIAMKRESRRLLGDVILTQNDFDNFVEYPDASFTTTWPFDLHYAAEDNAAQFPGEEFIAETILDRHESWVTKPAYNVPYRVLYSRNIDNLFIGGRAMSVTHVALGSVRVMSTLGLAGEVTGMAAKICIDNDEMPRGVYERHLDDLKAYMEMGAPLE
ncbi:MAG: FAD-dependent oxidoreductase [Rikenellaceae bacterium]